MRRYMANKAEDFLRSAAGMPPRPGSRKARKEAAGRNNNGYDSTGNNDSYGYYDPYRSRRRSSRYYNNGPIIPKEYAEDVEFVETKEFSRTSIDSAEYAGNDRTDWHESQVSDAEWEEIKTKHK